MTPARIRARAAAQQRRAATEQAYSAETIRALTVLIDRYRLDVYGHAAAVDVSEPVAVLVEIWRRSLRLS